MSQNNISKKNFSNFDHRKYYPKKQLLAWEIYKKFKNFTQFALNFCFSNGFNYIIPGMLNKREIEENIMTSKMSIINKKNLKKIYKIYLKNEKYFWRTKKPKKV